MTARDQWMLLDAYLTFSVDGLTNRFQSAEVSLVAKGGYTHYLTPPLRSRYRILGCSRLARSPRRSESGPLDELGLAVIG